MNGLTRRMRVDTASADPRIGELLGRTPRGLRGVPVVDSEHRPVVLRVAPLVQGRPFPTLFWLVDPVLNLAIDRAEAGGLIKDFQERINGDGELRRGMASDHRAYIRLRRSCAGPAEWSRVETLGFEGALTRRGIGGIEDPRRVRCLHTWYASHLVVPNTVGALLEAYWRGTGQREPLEHRNGCVLVHGDAGLCGFLEA